MRKKLFVVAFCTLLVLPITLSLIANASNITIDVSLGGYKDYYARPKFYISSYLNGTYQKEFEQWWGNHFVSRGIMIKSYNQIRFDLLRLGNEIVGKNKVLYEPDYILEYLCIGEENNFALKENQEKVDRYISQLEEVNQKLQKIGKQLILYITPSKCDDTKEYIPMTYQILSKMESKKRIRAVDYVRERLKETELVFIDGEKELKESGVEYPSFYSTGIHLSRTAEQVLHLKILNTLSDMTKDPIKKFKLLEVEEQDSPYWRDADLWELMNVWEKPEERYYQYRVKRILPQQYENKGFLIQGGSFADGLRKDLAENAISPKINYIFYNNYLMDQNGYYYKLNPQNTTTDLKSDWSNLEISKLLDETDVIIIELNEKHIRYFSNGFVEYLNESINNYKRSSGGGISKIRNWIPEGNYQEDLDWLFGIYNYEEGFAWGKDYCSFILQNEQISKKGLEIDFEISSYWNFQDTKEECILVYINGVRCKQLFVSQAGRIILNFLPEELPISQSDQYQIELYTTQSFIPSKLSINGDNRELSIILRYVGEGR